MNAEFGALREAFAAHASRVALREGGRAITYAALEDAVAGRAQALASLEARRVAIALDNGADWVAWDLALLATGRVAVPVPGFFSPSQQRHVLDSAGIDTLVGTASAAVLEGFAPAMPGAWRREVANPVALPPGTRKITYTSGTTGRPKGACLDASAQLAVAMSLREATRAANVERHLAILPLATLLENVGGVYAPLLAGAAVELRPLAETGLAGSSGLDTGRFALTLAESRPHSVILLPQLLLALVALRERGLPVATDLRFVAVGGARTSPVLIERALSLGIPVHEGYGLSECASVVCLNTPGANRPGTVGRPLPHAEVRIAPDGEVMVRGPRMLGYVGETPAGDEWLATGDLGRLEDGFLTLHGRRGQVFVTAYGRNVNPEWVEAELVRLAPVAQAWVHGEARATNVAVLVPRAPGITDAALEGAVREANAGLPDYARVGRWLRAPEPFGPANGLATAQGRLRREALMARFGASLFDDPTPDFPA